MKHKLSLRFSTLFAALALATTAQAGDVCDGSFPVGEEPQATGLMSLACGN